VGSIKNSCIMIIIKIIPGQDEKIIKKREGNYGQGEI